MPHHEDVMGRCISISYGLDDPNSVVVIGFIQWNSLQFPCWHRLYSVYYGYFFSSLESWQYGQIRYAD